MKAPNNKIQIPNKLQIKKPKLQTIMFWSLEFGIYLKFGA